MQRSGSFQSTALMAARSLPLRPGGNTWDRSYSAIGEGRRASSRLEPGTVSSFAQKQGFSLLYSFRVP